MIPLLSGKAFADFTPAEYHAYVRSLYLAPLVPKPPAEYSVRLNAKLNPVITVRRKPKWLTSAEVAEIAAEISWPLQALWSHLLKKKIELRVPKRGHK